MSTVERNWEVFRKTKQNEQHWAVLITTVRLLTSIPHTLQHWTSPRSMKEGWTVMSNIPKKYWAVLSNAEQSQYCSILSGAGHQCSVLLSIGFHHSDFYTNRHNKTKLIQRRPQIFPTTLQIPPNLQQNIIQDFARSAASFQAGFAGDYWSISRGSTNGTAVRRWARTRLPPI